MKSPTAAFRLLALTVAALVLGFLPATVAVAAPTPTPPTRQGIPPVSSARASLARVENLPDAASDHARLATGKVIAVASVAVTSSTAVAGLTWPEDGDHPTVLYRTLRGGKASPWQEVNVEAASPGEGGGRAGTEPVVVTDADTVQFATLTDAPLAGEVTVYSSTVSPQDQVAAAAPAPTGTTASRTTTSAASVSSAVDGLRPAIKGRAAWGANEAIVGLPYEYAIVSGVMIHHTSGTNSYTSADVPGILRSIQAYHVNGRGWKDIAYNVLVDKFGTAWEGRGGGLDRAVAGGHGYGETNKRVFGLSFLGDYEVAAPPSVMISKAQDVIAWKFALHGVDPYGKTWGSGGQDGGSTFLNAISGHRDENATDCPGVNVYRLLPSIRSAVKAKLAGVSYQVTQPQPTPVEVLPTPDPLLGKVILPVNGQLDKATVIELQKWVGATADGSWGSGTTTALQKKIGASVTGARDTQTIKKLQAVVGAAQTGYLDSPTVVALQNFLNALPGTAPVKGAAVYSANVQNVGWQRAVADGGVAGTTSQGLRLEAFRLSVAGAPLPGDVSYRGYVEGIGWQPWTDSTGIIGTVGRGLRLEAFEVKLTGQLAAAYGVRYKAYVRDIGWQSERFDGETAGTTGLARPIEAIAVELIERASITPAVTVTGPLRSVDPCRVLDTRAPIGVPAAKQVPAWGRIEIDVTGPCGVPETGAGAVALNTTVTNGSAPGYLTVYPAGQPTPYSSNLNFGAGQTIANMVVANVGTGGRVAFFNGSPKPIDVVADVAGWLPAGGADAPGAFNAKLPTRILDTRGDDQGRPLGTSANGPIAANGTLDATVVGVGGVHATNVSAVIVNLTVTGTRAPGHLIAYPSDVTRPDVSNLNFTANGTVPNLAVVKVGPDGRIKLHNASVGTTHVIADVAGWITAGDPVAEGTFASLAPSRILDTRGTDAGPLGAPVAKVAGQSTLALQVTGKGGVPASGVKAVVLNLTVTNPTAPGHITAYPSGATLPTASNLNFVAGQTIPNLVVVKVGPDGQVNLFNASAQGVDLIADVAGYVKA